ncbi:MAG: long-chain fatty acid--CoA ligase [Actinobacteria bacterium]|nr:long-chain fatty acid--CoA ligase [Actinomycetota bacterium]
MTAIAESGVRTWTLAKQVRGSAASMGDGVAMRAKRLGVWRDITWSDYADNVSLVGHALLGLGIEPGDRVAIHSENRPEWLFTDLGTIAVRGITVGLYPTNPSAEVEYLLADSGSRILIAEDQEQVDKALAVESRCPALEHIVFLESRGVASIDHPKLMSWEDFLARGAAHREAFPDALDRRAAETQPDDVVTLVYTSGTTGPPKGAMLTNANVEFASNVIVDGGGLYEPPPNTGDVILSYLPLCHVAERAVTTWTNAVSGAVVHFAESIDTVVANLREVQPTLFFAVPRIWEKLKAAIEVRMAAASRIKRLNYGIWMKVGNGIAQSMLANGGRHTAWSRIRYGVGYVFLYRAMRDRIGLRKVRAAASAAAPIAPEVLYFFFMMGVPIHELYGMTENSAVATSNRRGRIKLGTVGEPHPGVEILLDEQTGEILTRHPGSFAGYWNRPDATADTLDAEGWLHTGDVGQWVEGTHLKIVDRIKDIIITAGGKNISPSELENAIKSSPFIREAIVIGDQRPYLVALIGIEEDTVGQWAKAKRIPYTTYRDLSEREEVLRLVQGIIAKVNEGTARVENIRKFRMITKALDHEDGDLTATQKVKRSALMVTFGPLIDDMYDGTDRLAGGDQSDVVVISRVEN